MMYPVDYKGKNVIAVVTRNNEDFGSMSYDRMYKLYDYNKLIEYSEYSNEDKCTENFIEDEFVYMRNLHVGKGATKLPFKEIDDLPPIEFKRKTYIEIKVAKPVNKKVWEIED